MKISLVVALSALLVPAVSEAARPWLLPSQTVLARSGGWVAVDAAMADDLFSVNQGAMPVDTLVVSGPDGQPVTPQNVTVSNGAAVTAGRVAAPRACTTDAAPTRAPSCCAWS